MATEASQESLKRPKKAPKRHPKKSKTPKKRDPKLIQKLTNFGPILEFKKGAKKGNQNCSKKKQKWNQNIFLLLFMMLLKSCF